jgi:hypothetical protein
MTSALHSELSAAQRAQRSLLAALALSMAGLLFAQNIQQGIGYTLVTVSALWPCALWVQAGMPGLPVWPAVAVMSWLYYAVPMLRDHLTQSLYTPAEVFSVAATVSIYLVTGTIAWRLLFSGAARRAEPYTQVLLNSSQMNGVIFLGLASGLAFLVCLGFWYSLGAYFGVARSIMLNACLIGCYLLGHARGTGSMRGFRWVLALGLLAANVLFMWTFLYLITGMTELLAVVAGYVLTTKRVPWIPLVTACLVLTVLHAGKAEMRQRYWGPSPGSAVPNTLSGAPVFLAEWFGAGITSLGKGEAVSLVIDRASLFQLLLRVQRLAPQSVSFLNGQTYALLPGMLIPRFLAPDKSIGRAAMILLNVQFGFQTVEGAQTTAIGWGLIAEAFANFGLLGVLGMGLIAGTIAGLFTRWSCGAAPVSGRSLVGIVGLVTMINVEGDFAGLLSSLWQSLASVAVLTIVVRLFAAGQPDPSPSANWVPPQPAEIR